MTKRFILPFLLGSLFANAQQFQANSSSLTGVYYAQSLWLDIQNDGTPELLLTGYTQDFNYNSNIYGLAEQEFVELDIPLTAVWGFAKVGKSKHKCSI